MNMYNQYQVHPEYDAYVYKDKFMQEPLCAIYKARGLKKIADMHKNQQLEKFSMMYALDQINVLYIPIIPENKKAFLNMNTVSDLQNF